MRPAIVAGDLAALSGIAGGITHVLPAVVGTLAAALGAAWYAVLLYDYFVHKRRSD